jgi:putative oxidoreductase
MHMDTGLLIARIVFGALMAAHGGQKLFGWLGGHGIAGTAGFLETLGFRPGRVFAVTAGFAELAGGLLVALGLLGPVGPALVLSVMIVAAVSVHLRNGLLATANGIELPLLYAAAAVALAFTGFGQYSLAAQLGLASSWTADLTWAALGAAVLGALANLGLRRTSSPATAAA